MLSSLRLTTLFTPLFTYNVATFYHENAGVLRYVNPKIGTYGTTPNGNGGMIPSVSPPFGMTRWTPQTRENFISQCPYHDADRYIHGFQATHQPAIWMGESGQVVLSPGIGDVKPLFTHRAHAFRKDDERSTPYVYEIEFNAESMEADFNATETALTATSHVGWLRLDFPAHEEPYVFVQATRKNWTGHITVDTEAREVYGGNPQRQDYALGPSRAPGFSGYFVSRFSRPFQSYGVTNSENIYPGQSSGSGAELGAYVMFGTNSSRVEVQTGVSFVSIEQARRNLDIEAPEYATFEDTVESLKQAWLDKLARVEVEGANQTDHDHDPKTIFYTSLFHALQYPADFSEPLTSDGSQRMFYSGYTDSMHQSNDSYYQSWSIWDTFRAEHSLLTLFAPERVNGMMRSLLQIYGWAGRLPMWANIVETNIMIGTHVDAVIANALERGFRSFNIAQAWEAVKKNAFVPPENDTDLLYYDREPYTPDEVRAGLTAYADLGYVPNDQWAESGSRTLDYAFDDYAAAIVAQHAGNTDIAALLFQRSKNYGKIYNHATAFMEAKNANGTWAGREQGWTEGDDWIYTFNAMHDPVGLAALMGNRSTMKAKLDEYFQGGYNDHSNEPSHHAPYLYSAIGYPTFTQNLTRSIAWENYNATSGGLSGNEDLGQMSAWYIFSALGFYPVNPTGVEYVVGSPFFEKVIIRWPSGVSTGGTAGEERTLVITAPGAVSRPFVKRLKVDGREVQRAMLTHWDIVGAESIDFEMSDLPQDWAGW
ncbi:hypothetical protein EJ03DRAFT_267461 [Teratosphaeria nubilosa]|uniref:Glycoside hydrolase family 92 protein n=1 Tax=Teratosphaeria nubilosa TaxID=161662 RepID=A0A6G1LHY5_9PEZI|nr:hypothetical protein EJ03DRAFT_267461 [Teratosphaeria nubilosa]